MLSLENPKWNELSHAYGNASDIPALLRQLASFPAETSSNDEPWFTLWSSLCHQGDVYSASFAAIPHVIAALASNPQAASFNYFMLPASVEVARVQTGFTVPPDLELAYFESLKQLPTLVAAVARPGWEEPLSTSALAAIAAATGKHKIAELLLFLEPDLIPEVIEWVQSR